MGNSNHKDHFKNRFSNVCVFEESLDTKNSIPKVNSPNSDLDFKEELKQTIDLPIENEIYESNEIALEDKSEQIKNFIFSEGEAPPTSDLHYHAFRSKSYVLNQNINISLFNAPKPKVKTFNEYISPFKLSNKCLGGSQWKIKKPNEVILDFEKNIIIFAKGCEIIKKVRYHAAFTALTREIHTVFTACGDRHLSFVNDILNKSGALL